jgi:hypothetical protein
VVVLVSVSEREIFSGFSLEFLSMLGFNLLLPALARL